MHLSHNRDTTKQHATKQWPLSKKCLFSLILVLSASYETNCTLVKDITKGISFVKNKIIDLLKVLRPRVLWDRVPSSLQSKQTKRSRELKFRIFVNLNRNSTATLLTNENYLLQQPVVKITSKFYNWNVQICKNTVYREFGLRFPFPTQVAQTLANAKCYKGYPLTKLIRIWWKRELLQTKV